MIALVFNGEDFQLAPDGAPVPPGARAVPIEADAAGLPPTALAFDGVQVRRRDVIGTWYVDGVGQKHAVRLDQSWQSVACGFADRLANAGGTWSPISPAAALQADLLAYANMRQWALATGGFTVTLAGAQHTFATDPTSLSLMDGKVSRFGHANPPASVKWQFAGVGFVTISAADFITASIAVADFVQATFDALEPIEAAILAGTIVDRASVDAAAWPANHQ